MEEKTLQESKPVKHRFLKKLWRIIKRVLVAILILILLFIVGTLGINLYMVLSTKNNMITIEEAKDLPEVDCIIVLGCSVRPGGKPSNMLGDRLDKAVDLYNAGLKCPILMSGDHKSRYYNEVIAMKNYVVSKGVDSKAVFLDHAGYSTYDSIYRAKEIYGADKVIIITQQYHLYRAVYIAEKMGITAYGIPAVEISYKNQLKRELREIGARDKDFFACISKPESEYLGETVTLSGDGDKTNDFTDQLQD